ncbi:hypothetical protein FRX31_021518 [Thalictrum thalictroides]|uniref:KIB1-4 beta-propeller domain-containing protein n=1 Tax=Thalictrum thalictroides TaxID=46969 RepID=A0A7J6VW23_THATH|nr:hypothetical protein FRX31_021518 [Thalictrum thalictroides]
MDKEVGEVNWLDLPFHVMSLILLKLVYVKDYIRFGAVCQSWHSIYTHNRDDYIRHLPHQLPVLIVTTEAEKHIRHWQTRSYYDLSENRVCKFPLSVPHCDYFHSFFSSEGWLIRDEGQYVSLFNPFLSVDNVIMLPSLEDEDDEMGDDKWLGKAALSANPALNPNYVLMAVCFGNCWKAAFYKPGNPRWTSLLDCEEGDFIVDVIYSGYQFYAMTTDGSIWAYDLSSSIPNVSKVAPCIDQTERIGDCLRYYLVESLGELLGVKRNWSSKDSPYTLNFQVFRLDQNMFKWIETKSLSGRSLFVGNNTSMSIMASDFPRCKPNCIYFTHEGRNHEPFEEHSHDMGVYNLEDGSIEPHYLMESIKLNYPAPMWIEPTFTK